MTKISATVVADSIMHRGSRFTSIEVVMPRFILAELNTHRMLSKNSASSHAIPFKKSLDKVLRDPMIPLIFPKEHSGMSATEYWPTGSREHVVKTDQWLETRNKVAYEMERLDQGNTSKQITNRWLEPAQWHKVLISGTEWENFFYLRCPRYSNGTQSFRSKKDYIEAYNKAHLNGPASGQHPIEWPLERWLSINGNGAEPHMMELAECVWDAMNESKPRELKPGEYHLPYMTEEVYKEVHEYYLQTIALPVEERPEGWGDTDADTLLCMVSAAFCARTSYTIVGKDVKLDVLADIKLAIRLLVQGHCSPFEHIGKVMTNTEYDLSAINSLVTAEEYNEQSVIASPNHMYFISDGMYVKKSRGWSGNVRGFIQYRKMLFGENRI